MFRTDGEAFCIVLADAGLDDALALAERLRRGIARGAAIDNVHFVLTASAGLTELGAEDTAASLLERAALALGRAPVRPDATGSSRWPRPGDPDVPGRGRSGRRLRRPLTPGASDPFAACAHARVIGATLRSSKAPVHRHSVPFV